MKGPLNVNEKSNIDSQDSIGMERERLLSLIEFAQESARLKINPVSEVIKYGIFNLFEHQLLGLPGIQFNKCNDEDEIWLSIERLWESKAPTPTDNLLGMWIDLSNNPDKNPTLKSSIESGKINESTDANPNQKELILLSNFDQREHIERLLEYYIENQWIPWTEIEKKRRNTIKIYSELFTLKQQLEGSISDSPIELVWGIGMGTWKCIDKNICFPVLTQLVNISLNENNMSIEIRPNQAETRLEMDVYMSIDNLGVSDLEKAYNDFILKQTTSISPFDQISYEPILRLAVTHLDSKGIYYPDHIKAEDRQLPKSEDALKITNTWILFARPRNKNLFIQDLEKFKSAFTKDNKVVLSDVVKSIVTEASDVHKDVKFSNFRGISSFYSSGSHDTKTTDLFFPMPFNQEQVNIVQMLECHDGVVVQGPPGTGKTHTIANIISHYLANGKSVLVTSMKEPALSVLKEKLPESIRPLAISLLINEQEGMKQFEFTISKIAQEVQSIDRNSLTAKIQQIEQYLDQLHAKLAFIDRSINEWAKNNIEPIHLDNELINPNDAANEIKQSEGQYEWLTDTISIKDENKSQFDNSDIIRLREIRRNLNADLVYWNAKLPEINAFPESTEILRIHRDLARQNKLKEQMEENNLPPLADSLENIFIYADSLLKAFTEYEEIKKKIETSNKSWVPSIQQYLKDKKSTQILHIFEKLSDEITEIVAKRNQFIEYPIYLPQEFEITEEVLQAIINKGNGKSAFGLTGFLNKSQLRKKIDQIKIVNKNPTSSKDWQYIYHYLFFLRRSKALILKWNSLAKDLTMPILSSDEINNSMKTANEELEIYHLIIKCNKLELYISETSITVCPHWPYTIEIIDNADKMKEFRNILECHLNCHQLSKAWSYKESLQNQLFECNGRVSEEINEFINKMIGDPSFSDVQLQTKWSELMQELRLILSKRNYFADIKEICKRISDSGAPNWANKLSTEPLTSSVDYLLPDNWMQAWRLRRLTNYLKSVSRYDEFKNLTSQRSEIEKLLSKTYQEAVAKRTWLKLADNTTPDIKAALQAFQAAISKIGKGKGKRAIRYRRDAQVASDIAIKAIPCWIMSHYKVSESLPSEFGCFDLVIIDEASQSDLSALPTILRAKKLLVVGDDKQVSPEGIGLEEEKIKNLMTRFLANQVELFRQEMSPERSIYDLCKVVFADSQVMLREHFRCVAPIIEYSKREFYNHELIPLRLPKKSERLDPPLIDVLVEDGFRNNKENTAEAKFILEEIKLICNDEKMANKTIGVVSLLGNDQARKIWEMLGNEIGPDQLTKHKIACGDARTFQGNERDIMFLSMVVTNEDNKA